MTDTRNDTAHCTEGRPEHDRHWNRYRRMIEHIDLRLVQISHASAARHSDAS